MFRSLYSPLGQVRGMRKNHSVTFLRWFLQRNIIAPSTRAKPAARISQPSNHSPDREIITLSLRSYIRPTVTPCCTTIRLSSTTDPNNPARIVDADAHPPNKLIRSNIHLVNLRSWAFAVEPFGNLSINTSLSVRVSPLNPHDHPAADRAFVHLLLRTRRRGDESKRMLDALGKRSEGEDSLLRRFVRCDVQYNDDAIHVVGDALEPEDRMASMEDVDYMWLIEVPMSYDVDAVTTNEGTCTLEQLENQTCKVLTDQGDIVTTKLKSDKMTLRSSSGDINCLMMLQGNITIATGDHGSVTTDRLQGQDVCITTESGAIAVKDVYARKSSFESVRGDISLGNLHGDVTVTGEEGNLKIGSLDGSLTADVQKGNVSVFLAKHKDVDITCKQGDISIKTSSDTQTKLHLQASGGIDFPEELAINFTPETAEENSEQNDRTTRGDLNGGQESSLKAVAQRGSISLAVQSWFDSLQLQK